MKILKKGVKPHLNRSIPLRGEWELISINHLHKSSARPPGYTPILSAGGHKSRSKKTAGVLLVIAWLEVSGHCFPSLCPAAIYSGEKMAGVFSYESSEVDWCEDNYKHSEHVVEYFNTVSSSSLYGSIYCMSVLHSGNSYVSRIISTIKLVLVIFFLFK